MILNPYVWKAETGGSKFNIIDSYQASLKLTWVIKKIINEYWAYKRKKKRGGGGGDDDDEDNNGVASCKALRVPVWCWAQPLGRETQDCHLAAKFRNSPGALSKGGTPCVEDCAYYTSDWEKEGHPAGPAPSRTCRTGMNRDRAKDPPSLGGEGDCP